MPLTPHEVLDKAVEAGGVNLAKTFAGSGKPAAAVVDQLVADGLLVKSGAKYSLTAEGRAKWEQDAPEERLNQERDKKAKKRRDELELQAAQRQKQLVAFVEAVKKKAGKDFKKDLGKFDESIRKEAIEQKLVVEGTKENTFFVQSAGEELLLSMQPLDKQLESLGELRKQIEVRWKAATKNVGGEVGDEVASLAEQGNATLAGFDEAIAALGGVAKLAEIAKRFRADIEAKSQALTEKESQLRRETERLREALERLSEDYGAFDRRAEAVMAKAAEAKPVAVAVAVSPPVVEKATPPSDAVVWAATQAAHAKIRQENLRLGGIVKVPELTDAVRSAVDGLTVEDLHQRWQKWQPEGKMTLQLCSDPGAEKRAAEGIHSPSGLLYYVEL